MNLIDHFSPLPASVTIGKSKIHGLGIIATDDIKSGVDLGISHVKNAAYKDGYIRTPLGGFVNHSDNPNSEYVIDGNNQKLVTKQVIKKGEEITASYRGYYDDTVLDNFN